MRRALDDLDCVVATAIVGVPGTTSTGRLAICAASVVKCGVTSPALAPDSADTS